MKEARRGFSLLHPGRRQEPAPQPAACCVDICFVILPFVAAILCRLIVAGRGFSILYQAGDKSRPYRQRHVGWIFVLHFSYLVGDPPLRDIDRQPELAMLPSEVPVYPHMCIIIVPLLERPRTS